MEAKDLRIGNIIQIPNGDIRSVSGITQTQIHTLIKGCNFSEVHFNHSDIKPIPLTEEWLLKFGAKELKAKRGVLKEYVLKKVRLEISNSYNIYYKNSKIIIQSVHQLQNLYHALTGQELTL